MSKTLYYTKSLCPHCLTEIPAAIRELNGEIWMFKSCARHGDVETLIWQDNAEGYLRWLEYGGIDISGLPQSPQRAEKMEFPYGAARAPACSAALMVTDRCDNHCPICFTRGGGEEPYDPPLEELQELMRYYRETAGEGAPLEFCGGEPTVRDDLPALARSARDMGFDYIQLNTNGIRLAQDPGYCLELAQSGITTVYLGFDGITPAPYIQKYGRDLLEVKRKAVEHCRQADLAVVLVVCVVQGSNDGQLGGILCFAKEWIPTVKGVYFQPLSYFGRYPAGQSPRITIPGLLRLIREQTGGEIMPESFLPGSCEHAQCSFGGSFLLDGQGRLKALTRMQSRRRVADAHLRVRDNVKKTWRSGALKSLTVGGMGFMDAWNIDAARLSLCTVQVIGRDKRLFPLCGKYLTGSGGERLCPGIS